MDELNHLEQTEKYEINIEQKSAPNTENIQVLDEMKDKTDRCDSPLLLQSQLCSSCRYEKAVVICTICNESAPSNAFLSSEKIGVTEDNLPETCSEDIYFRQTITLKDTEKIAKNDSKNKYDLDLLMRKGNMVYCNECFKDVHRTNTHIPIEIFQVSIRKESLEVELDQKSIELEPSSLPVEAALVQVVPVKEVNIEADTNVLNDLVIVTDETSVKRQEDSVIIDLLNEMVSISSSNLEQEELDRKAADALIIHNHMAGLFNGLKNLNVRCEQFNDVKISIKQMNDLIRNDIFNDFGSINTMIRNKLDEVTNTIKEKLKDAYSVVRDTQTRIANKISEIKVLADRIQMLEALEKANSFHNSANSLSELPFVNQMDQQYPEHISHDTIMDEINIAYEKINQINDELKQITESSEYITSVSANDSSSHLSNSCSLFVDNSLYPKFNYFVDTRKLVEAINEIEVEIGSTNILNPKNYFLDNNDNEKYPELPRYLKNSSFFATITSGIANDGSFWVQLNFKSDDHLYSDTSKDNNFEQFYKRNQNTKINMFIEEISKYIRKKRIGDKTWQTYAEASRTPIINEKCFCLESKTRKWLRAKIFSYEGNVCQVRFMDTGYGNPESNKFTLDNILIWKDFDLAMYPARVIKCVLHNNDIGYLNNVALETKFYFKDNFANKVFKCELIENIMEENSENLASDELTWIINLNKINASVTEDSYVNKSIIEYNNHELLVLENKASSKNKFRSIDIRVESGTVGVSNQLVKTNCEEANKTHIISSSSSFTAHNNDKNTDSECTQKASDPICAASSVNSFSEKIIEETANKHDVQINKKNDAASLPIMKHEVDKVNTYDTSENENIQQTENVNGFEQTKLLAVSMFEKTDANNNNLPIPKMDGMESIDDKVNYDVDDQNDENRFYRDRHGICTVMTHIEENGVFWIRPETKDNFVFAKYNAFIGDFITKTQWKSFSELHIVPEKRKKCFFKFKKDWGRGFIEDVEGDLCRVRNLDTATSLRHTFENVYPHRRLTLSSNSASLNYSEIKIPFHSPKYKAIRCIISPNTNLKLGKKSRHFFHNIKGCKVFDLIEQITIDGQKCWFTTLREHNKMDILNEIVLRINQPYKPYQKEVPQSKSSDIISSLRINDDDQTEVTESVSLQANLALNHEHLINQGINTIQNLQAMGPAYLNSPNFTFVSQCQESLSLLDKPISLLPLQKQGLYSDALYHNSLPIQNKSESSSRHHDEIKKKKKQSNKRRNKAKDDFHLDSSHSDRSSNNHHRRRSRSTENLSRKEKAINAENSNQNNEALQAKWFKAENDLWDEKAQFKPTKSPRSMGASLLHSLVLENCKQDLLVQPQLADTNIQHSKPQINHTNNTSNKKSNRKPSGRTSCRPDNQHNRFRRTDRDDDYNDKRPGGDNSNRHFNHHTIIMSHIESRDQNQQNHNSENQNYDVKETGLYKASVLNNFPTNHSDFRYLSQSGPQLPYVVNWGYDDGELNSSAFNDVFIEDNYCTTDNDYDSQYGDDSEEVISNNDDKSQYKFFKNPKISEDKNFVLLESTSADQLGKIRVTGLRDITNECSLNESKSLGPNLAKSRCVYSIVEENDTKIQNGGECTENEHDNMIGIFNDEVETSRSGPNKSDFGSKFLTKWNSNFIEKNDFDILEDSSLNKSIVMLIDDGNDVENDVTTLDLTARHINISPGLSGDCDGSCSTKSIRPQVNNIRFIANKQSTLISNAPDNHQKVSYPLSNSSSGNSVKKSRNNIIASSSTTTRRTEEEDNDFYISCAEEIRSGSSSLLHDEKNNHTVHANKSAQTESHLYSKLEKMKQFTVAVFVDSIEDYSFEKIDHNNNSNISVPSSLDLNTSNMPTIHNNKNLSQSDLDDVFLSRNRDTPTSLKAQQNEYFKFTSNCKEVNEFVEPYKPIKIQPQTELPYYKQQYDLDENLSPSLKEFVAIEKTHGSSQESRKNIYERDPTLNKPDVPVVTDDLFIYNLSPNYSVLNRHALASKPPAVPSSSSPTGHIGVNPNNKLDQHPLLNVLNGSNQCLSTIEECSNETFETCSNQSPHMKTSANRKSHSTSYEDDDDNHEWTIEKKTFDDKNVTIRRARKLTDNTVVSEDFTIRENDHLNESISRNMEISDLNHDHFTLTDLADQTTSIKITDKLFEKFCLISNDEIMKYSSQSFSDSLEYSASLNRTKSLSSGNVSRLSEAVKETRINRKLLNEILNTPVDEPRSDQSSSSSQRTKNSKQPNQQIITSSPSCSKISSVSKQTVVPATNSNLNRQSNTSTVAYSSLNNLNYNTNKDQEFGFDNDEEDDDVFLNEKNGANSLGNKSVESSESDETNIKKISSKSLNSIIERKSFISTKTSSLPPSATTSDPSFPMLNVSSSRSSARQNNKTTKFKQKNNLSATTTLEISSYTSDSLYNSNFIVTPMCSEAISPALYTNFFKSSSIQQGSPLLSTSIIQPSQTFSASCPNYLTNVTNNSLTPKSRSQLVTGLFNSETTDSAKQNISKLTKVTSPSSPSPPPPFLVKPKTLNFQKQSNSGIFPSPPSLTMKYSANTISQSSPSDSFPLPPTFLDNHNNKSNTLESELSQGSVKNSEHQNTEFLASKSKSARKTKSAKNKGAKNSLIAAITERLNLAPERENPTGVNTHSKTTEPYNGIDSLFKKNKANSSKISVDKTKKANPSDLSEKIDQPRKPNLQQELNFNGIDEIDASNNWKAAKFSLWGLDVDDDEKSSADYNLLAINHWQDKLDSQLTEEKENIQEKEKEEDDSLPLPPPPFGFDDNNNYIDDECNVEKYANIDDLNMGELINKENETRTSAALPHPPSFINQSSNTTFMTPTKNSINEYMNEEPTKDDVVIPSALKHNRSSMSPHDTVIQNQTHSRTKNFSKCHSASPKSNKFEHMNNRKWNNFNCDTLPVNSNTLSLLPDDAMTEKKQMLENHLKGKKETGNVKRNLYTNINLHKSCPILSPGSEINTTNIYKNDEFIEEVTTVTSEGKREFKLDHLLDINPKRLFKGCKFRCRIHDVIDENGRFWIEVIYSKEDERKFNEIFKLFRLCSKINEPPREVYPNMRVSAFYKNDWHRAIVLDRIKSKSMLEKRVRVRFVDLGIIKILDRETELREIDQKFFNCPLKALKCTINIDKSSFDSEFFHYQNEDLSHFRFTKEARKYFTKIIYKRVLYAKVINFIPDDVKIASRLDLDDTQWNLEEGNSICQVILGAQFQRGIIDIYMYLLSKYDRPYYDILKKYHNQQEKLLKEGVIKKTVYNSENESSFQATNSHIDTSNETNETITNESQHEMANKHANETGANILNSELLQMCKEEFMQSYGMTSELMGQNQNDNIINEDEQTDFTDDESIIEETENPLFVNCQDNRLHETIIFSSDSTSSESYFSVSDDDDFKEVYNETSNRALKQQSFLSQRSGGSYNYSESLNINSIVLPPIEDSLSFEHKSPINIYPEQSTAKIRGRKINPGNEFNFTPIILPPGNSLKPSKQKHLLENSNNNANSDTDTSIGAPCCTGLHKLKWNSASKLRQIIISSTLNKSKECPELSVHQSYIFANQSQNNSNKKKVKFQTRH